MVVLGLLALAGARALAVYQERNSLKTQLAAEHNLAAREWPTGLTRVANADGCLTGANSVCLSSSADTVDATSRVAALLTSATVTTGHRMPGAAETYLVRGQLDGQNVMVLVEAHRTGGSAAKGFTFAGSTADVSLTDYDG